MQKVHAIPYQWNLTGCLLQCKIQRVCKTMYIQCPWLYLFNPTLNTFNWTLHIRCAVIALATQLVNRQTTALQCIYDNVRQMFTSGLSDLIQANELFHGLKINID